ncbi:hypothetical protein V1284_003042 [Nitrobacteraceae bacterium AZCC 2299]
MPKAAAPFLLGVVEIDADDLVGANHAGALDHVEADAAEPEHHDIGARRHLGGVDHRADPGGDAAADIAAGVERRVVADPGDGDLGQHREIREGRAAHVMIDRLALVAEARGAVGHHALALGGADRGAEIGLLAQAAFALPAFRRVERDDMIAGFHRADAGPDLANDAGAFMAEDRGKDALAVKPVERIGIGVADAGGLDLDQHLAMLRTLEIDLDDLERLLGLKGDGGARFHSSSPAKFSCQVAREIQACGVCPVFLAAVFRRSAAHRRKSATKFLRLLFEIIARLGATSRTAN